MARNFLGFTDPYAARLYRSSHLDAAMSALKDNRNFLAIERLNIKDVRSISFSDEYRNTAIQRWAQYSRNQEFYLGDHFHNPVYDGFPKFITNFCGMIVDKTVEWVVAKGFKILPADGQSMKVSGLVDDVWEDNAKNLLLSQLVMESAIKGDSYLYVSVVDKDDAGVPLPRNEWRIKLNALPAEYCYPIYRDDMPEIPVAVLVSYPILTQIEEGGEPVVVQFGMFATKDQIVYLQDSEVKEVVENPLKEVPVVHFAHSPSPGSKFGQSEITKISSLNERYNEVMTTMSKIIEYCGEPTTIVQGAKLVNLERGANKVWSNIPADGKVYNLELKSELDPIQNYLNRVENDIFRLAETPKIAFDTQDDGYSNTSGVAMQMLFQPLVEKTQRIHKSYTKGIQVTNRLILKIHERILGTNVDALFESPEGKRRKYMTKVKYTTLLPKDENEELDRVIKKLDAGLISRAEAIRTVTQVENPEQHSLELLMDKVAKLTEAFENQKAVQLIEPAVSSAALGSECLTEGVQSILSLLEKSSKNPSGNNTQS